MEVYYKLQAGEKYIVCHQRLSYYNGNTIIQRVTLWAILHIMYVSKCLYPHFSHTPNIYPTFAIRKTAAHLCVNYDSCYTVLYLYNSVKLAVIIISSLCLKCKCDIIVYPLTFFHFIVKQGSVQSKHVRTSEEYNHRCHFRTICLTANDSVKDYQLLITSRGVMQQVGRYSPRVGLSLQCSQWITFNLNFSSISFNILIEVLLLLILQCSYQ